MSDPEHLRISQIYVDPINRKNNFLPGLSFPDDDDDDEVVPKDSFQMTDFKEKPINGQVNPAFEDDISDSNSSEGMDDDEVFESASTQGDVTNSSQQPNGDIKKRKSTKKKENHLWDVFRVTSEDNISDSDLAIWRTIFIITKIIIVFFFFVIVLGTAVITKITFLIMTSNIYVPSKTKDVNFTSDGPYKIKELDGKLTYKQANGDAKIEVTWIWALITVMSAPYFFTICKCLWKLCFNKTRSLKIIPLLVALVTETLHSFGLFILMVVVLPQFEPLAAAFAILPVATIPSLLKIIYPERTMKKTEGTMLVARLVNIIAFVLCVTSIGCFCFYIYFTQGSTLLMILTAVCPVFISLSWWENFARQGDKESMGIPKLKRKLRQCKTKISILTNLWKLILNYGVLPSLVFGANCDAGTSCIHMFFLQFEESPTTFKFNTYLYPGDAVLSDSRPFNRIVNCIKDLPFIFALVNIASSIICFKVGKAACKVLAQRAAFSLPLVLSTPVTIALVLGFYSQSAVLNIYGCYTPFPAWDGDATTIMDIINWYWPVLAGGVAAFFSLLLITNHIWSPGKERLVSTDKLYVQPLYCGVLLDQSLMLNRRRVDDEFKSMDEKNKSNYDIPIPDLPTDNPNWNPSEDWSILRKDDTPMIYMCATMWHETELEMTQILKSIFRMDEDQCARRNLQMFLGIKDPDYYEFEVHVFFDDAFDKHTDEEYEYKVNNYVKMLVRVINLAATSVHNTLMKIPPPTKIPTPYGGRLIWRLPGGNKIIAHLKDKMKIRHRKRWSQVMYMYYFLGYKLISMKIPRKRKKVISENTFLLALDGDVDFQPSAVQLLVDRMKKNPSLGATCGRIHPIGSGPMVWYQKFEYAISHWLQKATEHTLGCVLCSPGCFSLFRGSSLMDDNVMRRYTTPPSEPAHYVQYDQGEDRWLCTLLLQQGYRVEYVAASDALTYAPEGFNEFYNQRRRWTPSTMANILDLLMDWKNVRRKNADISLPYIGYQMFLMVSSILTPGTIFLMILGAITTGFPGIQPWTALVLNLLPVAIFILLCFVAKSDVQLTYAAILSVIYSLVMMIVLVGLLREAATAGVCSVTTIFLCFVAGVFVLSAFLHPQEFFCIIHGFLYFLSIPSMSMLLMIYSLGNLHVVSWGTRETTQPTQSATQQKANQSKGMVQGWLEKMGVTDGGSDQKSSDYNFSCGNLFRCMCCPQKSSGNNDRHLAVILERLDDLDEKVTEYTRSQNNSQYLSPASSVVNEKQNPDLKPFSQNALLFEGEAERANPLFKEEKQKKRDELKDPYWIHDDEIKDGATVYLPQDEVQFWDQFIGEYLFPIIEDKKQKKEIEKGLLELRNKVCLAFLLINAMFVTIVYALTEVNAADSSLSVPLWCRQANGDKQATVEPISFAFTAVFGVLLFIQFICMLFHRTATLLHILAATEIGFKKRLDKIRKSPEEADDIADITVADGLKLVRDMQASNDDESDTKSVISVATTVASEDDAGDTLENKGKRDLWKKLARRRKENMGHNTLSKNFLKNFNKLHQVIHEDDDASTRGMSGSDDKEESEDNLKKVQSKFGKRFNRQSLYTIVNMTKNPQLKQRISERAERVNRWENLKKKIIKDPEQKGRSGFASIAKLALQNEKLKQQQQTVEEQEEETTVGKTKADISPQLPDRGEEWPEEDNYAIVEPDYDNLDDDKTKDLKNSDVLF